jgi:hypothetical protein
MLTATSYLEALDVLYNANMFSFRGAAGVLQFHSLVSVNNWQKTRRLSLSTTFVVPMSLSKDLWNNWHSLPPEDYVAWGEACTVIGTLHHLQYLQIDMTLWSYRCLNLYHKQAHIVSEDELVSILGPLKHTKAKNLELEINMPLSETAKALLEPLNVTVLEVHRPYNAHLSRQG